MPPPTKRHTRLANRVRDRLAGARPGLEALTGLGCELVPGSRFAGTGLRDTVAEPDVAAGPPRRSGPRGGVPARRPPAGGGGGVQQRPARAGDLEAGGTAGGGELVWVLDPKRWRAWSSAATPCRRRSWRTGRWTGEAVLPGFRLPLADLWDALGLW